MVGVCICERHGRAGLDDVCHHIASAVSAGAKPPEIIRARSNSGNFAGSPDAPMMLTLLYCQVCAEDFGFPPESCELPEAEWETILRDAAAQRRQGKPQISADER